MESQHPNPDSSNTPSRLPQPSATALAQRPLPTPQQMGLRPVPSSLQEVKTEAMACRTIQQAMACSTIRMVERVHGAEQVQVVIAAVVTKGMAYFSAQRRLEPLQVALLAETLREDYPNESLGDIEVFMRGAAAGKYGNGETYGALDVPRFRKWFAEYLEEKALARERDADAMEAEKRQAVNGLLSNPTFKKLNEEIRQKRREEEAANGLAARMERLRKHLPTMSPEALRDAWKLHPTGDERKLIQAQAARLGMLGDEIKEAQLKLDAEAAGHAH